MFCAGSGLAAGTDFSVFHDVAAEQIGVFVIKFDFFICTKLANLRPGRIIPAAGSSLLFRVCHF
jgi:hypothetical protein